MNKMEEHNLKKEIAHLRAVIDGLESTSKMLIQRDLDLRNAYEQLKSLDVEKTEFVSISAHQLRTPVTTARWALDYLLKDLTGNLTEKQLQLLQRAIDSVEHSHKLVEDLLELNRLDFGGIELHLQTGAIRALCDDIVSDHTHQAEAKKIRIQTHYDDHESVMMFDYDRLRDAIDNIVDNAIKYSFENGVITLETRLDGGCLHLTVSDTGIGVEEGQEEKIFHKFTRLGNAAQVDPNGTGLGLYISRKIIEKHGGSLTLTANTPRGSVFKCTLPIKVVK